MEAIFVSPLGRAQATAKPTAAALGITPVTLPWLREFSVLLPHPDTGAPAIPWDFLPTDRTRDPQLLDYALLDRRCPLPPFHGPRRNAQT